MRVRTRVSFGSTPCPGLALRAPGTTPHCPAPPPLLRFLWEPPAPPHPLPAPAVTTRSGVVQWGGATSWDDDACMWYPELGTDPSLHRLCFHRLCFQPSTPAVIHRYQSMTCLPPRQVRIQTLSKSNPAVAAPEMRRNVWALLTLCVWAQ